MALNASTSVFKRKPLQLVPHHKIVMIEVELAKKKRRTSRKASIPRGWSCGRDSLDTKIVSHFLGSSEMERVTDDNCTAKTGLAHDAEGLAKILVRRV